MIEITVIVLLVSVSVVASPTRVSVSLDRVNVPVLLIVLMIGDVSVLLVNVAVLLVPSRVVVASGNVITLFAVWVVVSVDAVLVVPPDSKSIFLVASPTSTIAVVVSDRFLLVRVCAVDVSAIL